MERILVTITGETESWEAFSRACSLARRIEAKLYVLFVDTPVDVSTGRSGLEHSKGVKKHLEMLLEAAKAEGVAFEYYTTEGEYEKEVIGFVRDNKITLLVVEHNGGDIHHYTNSLLAIRHRIACRVELVAPKKDTFNTQERNS